MPKLPRLSAGMRISYWDDGPSGPEAQIATIVRARGEGILVRRGIFNRYRILRSDVIRVLDPEGTD